MTGRSPVRLDLEPDSDAVAAAVAQLRLPDRSTTLVINGSTTDEPGWPTKEVRAALRAAVLELTTLPGEVIVSGGTQAGLFALLGDVVAETEFDGPVIGVAPAGRIDGGHHTPLEPHHMHVLVVDVPSWGTKFRHHLKVFLD